MQQKGAKRVRGKRKRISVKILVGGILLIGVAFFLYSLHLSTGIFQPYALDERDISSWSYDEEERIRGAAPYTLVGTHESCWLLIHSYGATPAEMRELAETLHDYFGDTVIAPLLKGHGTLPSALEGENGGSWYEQSEAEFLAAKGRCKEINVIGSSLGGSLALRLAEEHEVKNLYLINPFLTKTFSWYKILPFEWRLRLFSPLLRYDKRAHAANIQSPRGKEQHITYRNLPYAPIRESLAFLKAVRADLPRIKEPIFIAHSRKDEVAAPAGAQFIYQRVSSTEKELRWVEQSNHVLLMDYDSDEITTALIAFEELHR